jgi:hypothetical protein
MEHLCECVKLRYFWNRVFDFTVAMGQPPPQSRTEAIVFNLWHGDSLAPPEVQAVMRHAFGAMYRNFALVDTEDRAFVSDYALRETFVALRLAIVRRAAGVKLMHARRAHTNEASVIAQADAAKYPSLVSMGTDGTHAVSGIVLSAISDAEEEIRLKKEKRNRKRAAQAALANADRATRATKTARTAAGRNAGRRRHPN